MGDAQYPHLTIEKVFATALINRLAIARLARRCGKSIELGNDLKDILDYIDQVGIPLASPDRLPLMDHLKLEEEVKIAVHSMLFELGE